VLFRSFLSANEALRSINEEFQSANEELQSTNEELETTKEELQSVNEELATVNTELQTKMEHVSELNNDMNNLLAGTGIATVFVDQDLHILRFTPTAPELINLIRSDVGRPVGHVVSNLVGYDRLLADVQAVLDTLVPQEVEVQTRAGAWYTLRIQPYRTLDNVIEGAVITFVEITERKRAEEALQKAADDIRTLRGILPICMNCKRIRDDQGYWNQVEVYIRDRTEADFSHSLCPECMKKLYPEFEQDAGSAPDQDKGAP
jgi:two-component system, chemotaxis family, CheB/CheR fusion protein